MKKCPFCGETRHEKDQAGWMCSPCRVGLDVDIARVRSVPRRIKRALSAFWKEATDVS